MYYFNTKKSHPFIIDCGSHIGKALIFFKKLYPNSKIIVFEPDNRKFKILKKNVETNNLKGVKMYNKAVYNYDGTINFYYDLDHPSYLGTTVKDNRLTKDYEKVESVLLSNYINETVDFLKMDIEGDEDLVIEELSRRNKLKLVKEMSIECHSLKDQELERDNFSKILGILIENGFNYQISTHLRPPFIRGRSQNILLYAYQK